jgi:hypothetical protein
VDCQHHRGVPGRKAEASMEPGEEKGAGLAMVDGPSGVLEAMASGGFLVINGRGDGLIK